MYSEEYYNIVDRFLDIGNADTRPNNDVLDLAWSIWQVVYFSVGARPTNIYEPGEMGIIIEYNGRYDIMVMIKPDKSLSYSLSMGAGPVINKRESAQSNVTVDEVIEKILYATS